MNDNIPVERHPLEPFLPEGARILMLGSFPPKRERWSMEFFYPNWINDMWRLMGYLFFGDREHFVAADAAGRRAGRFDRERIVGFCSSRGIALYDTACEVRRLKDNASDKFLEIVKKTDLHELLAKIPLCGAVATTGQKATDAIVDVFGCARPPIGGMTEIACGGRSVRFWRMPSSSRAYPLPLEKKAGFYRRMFEAEGLLQRPLR